MTLLQTFFKVSQNSRVTKQYVAVAHIYRLHLHFHAFCRQKINVVLFNTNYTQTLIMRCQFKLDVIIGVSFSAPVCPPCIINPVLEKYLIGQVILHDTLLVTYHGKQRSPGNVLISAMNYTFHEHCRLSPNSSMF